MGTQQIVERILEDASLESAAILKQAEEKSAKLLADASARAQQIRIDTEKEVEEKRQSILEKRAAAARLECSKLVLKEKRRVIDAIYDEAHSRLLELSKENCLQLTESLLEQYAEAGDEIFFSKSFAYVSEVQAFPVVQTKGLMISSERADIAGGMLLKGKVSDKDLSYAALLSADRAENEAQLAADIF